MINELDQKDGWKEAKWGMFSASELWKLTIEGKEDKKTGVKDMFGETGHTYIKTVARQAYTLFNEEDQPETFAMKLGKAKEGDSYAYYRRLIGLPSLIYYGGGNPLFEHYCPDSGASPDALAWVDGKVSFGAEFKNPSGNVHWDYLEKIHNQWDLKKESIEYYTQCQFAMMVFKTDLWHWCTHNEYFKGNARMLIIEVAKDKPFQDNLEIRLKMAIKRKYERIEVLKKLGY